ncbi:uracil-DNA glycosylase family protein [Litoreibacter arenae]|uniref:Uracil-DNA glycosylase-like domain-containing protein n=1 Tax=Litoreibacter arenae DSM 19593 TaxID=1123360 RepID=S9Q746_9RHOB|nr:uracil-DNA glycosylase family protein [Litoreibacter arenae]EPX77191.1 Hypothetical protein thalar_02913 [Litoreibacter arenae DSM 19593]
MPISKLKRDLSACTICKDRFAATRTRHGPRPIVWFDKGARLLIASQAPGARAHDGGRPFIDPSGNRLRDWMGVDGDTFYDRSRVAIVPMAFCFPGYNAQGSDLPPPPVCAKTWRADILEQLPDIRLTLLIGGYAQKYHLGGDATSVTDTVARWRDHAPAIIPLPHPSWRNTAWIKRNPWFETELLPVLKSRVKEALAP